MTNEPIILTHEQHVNEIALATQWTVDRLLREFFAPDRYAADLEVLRICMERS